MITPSYGLTATERVLPKLALDFTTAALDPRVTLTRTGNTATVINSSGVIVGVNANLPRFDFDPITLICKGLLIEETRANALLNSLIDGTSLATQIVTVTAAARTLSFYGTGTVVLSGAHSATVTGTGAYPTRTILTFTPSAGALTLTVTGTVQFAQLEIGQNPTSFIPTAASAVTRNADNVSMTGANFSSWFNASGGTMTGTGIRTTPIANPRLFSISDGTNTNRIDYITSQGLTGQPTIVTSGSVVCDLSPGGWVVNAVSKIATSFQTNNFRTSKNAGNVVSDTLGGMPTVDRLYIGVGATGSVNYLNGYVQKLAFYTPNLTSPELRSFSK